MKESQTKQIFDYLMTGCRLTGLEALKLFGSMKLPNRIGEVEEYFKQRVDRKMIEVKTRVGTKRVMQYWIEPKLIKK